MTAATEAGMLQSELRFGLTDGRLSYLFGPTDRRTRRRDGIGWGEAMKLLNIFAIIDMQLE